MKVALIVNPRAGCSPSGDIRWLARVAPRVALGIVALLALLAILWAYFNVKLGRQLDANLAALRGEGMPVTMVEAAPRPVPEQENAAVLYQQVFRVDFNEGGVLPGGLLLPEIPREDLDQARRDILIDGSSQIISDVLASPGVDAVLAILRQASHRPQCVFPVRWDMSHLALFPHRYRFRIASLLVAGQAGVAAKAGNVAEALAWCEVILRMSQHVAAEPDLGADFVCYAMQEIVFAELRHVLLTASLCAREADALQEQLSRPDLEGSFTKAMAVDRAQGCDIFTDVRTTPMDLRCTVPLPYYGSWLWRPLDRLDELIYLEYMDRIIEITKLPASAATARVGAIEAEADRLPFWRSPLARFLLCSRAYGRDCQRRDQALVNIGLCCVVLALKDYKCRHGYYPDSLQYLQHELTRRLPEDPFSGEDFIYRREGEGFLIYSIGVNLKDDSGKAEEDWEEGDIVWECAK